jgi:hypothetical protein
VNGINTRTAFVVQLAVLEQLVALVLLALHLLGALEQPADTLLDVLVPELVLHHRHGAETQHDRELLLLVLAVDDHGTPELFGLLIQELFLQSRVVRLLLRQRHADPCLVRWGRCAVVPVGRGERPQASSSYTAAGARHPRAAYYVRGSNRDRPHRDDSFRSSSSWSMLPHPIDDDRHRERRGLFLAIHKR